MEEEQTTESTEESEETQTEPTQEFLALLEEVKEQGRKEAFEKYQGYQKVVSARETENADLKRQLAGRPVSGAPSAGLTPRMIEALKTGDYEVLESEAKVQREEQLRVGRLEQQRSVTQGHRDRIRQEIVSAGHDPNDKVFRHVFREIDLADAVDGNFEWANTELAEALEANPKKEEPKSTDAALEAAKEEGKRQALEEKGLLKTESGLPSASGQSNEDFQKDFVAGKYRDDLDGYEKEARKRGILK